MMVTRRNIQEPNSSWWKAVPYTKGDRVDLKALVFTEARDYLIKSNTNEVVKAEQLEGKLIVLHFVLLHPEESWRWTNTAHLLEVYTELISSSSRAPLPFEVIFVPIHDYTFYDPMLQQRFNEVFSTMPWPAIPYSDVYSWEHLANCFVASPCSGYLPSSVAIDPSGVVLQSNALPLIRAYGADAYPFSDERKMCLDWEDDRVRECPSLKALLVSPERDYVINNRGDKVNVCDLEDKVVALYLYEDGCTDDLTASLQNVYQWCTQKIMKFEVVLIYIHDSSHTFGRTDVESFTKRFETMPWLALPFKDMNCKKVLRVFRYPSELGGGPHPDPSLVIIGPRGEFIEPLGASVLMNIGTQAYPFTRKKAYMLQIEKVKNLKLKMLFGREAVFTQFYNFTGTFKKVSLSEIDVQKTVIVFSEPADELYGDFKMKLMHKYVDMKGSSREFEVIHVGGCDGEVVPWLKMTSSRSRFDGVYKNFIKTFSDTLHYHGYGILVFDRDGKVVRATIDAGRFIFEASDFPFCGGCLEEEVVDDLNFTCNWFLS